MATTAIALDITTARFHEQREGDKPGQSPLVDRKWIYLFTSSEGGAPALWAEVYAMAPANEQPQYKTVDIAVHRKKDADAKIRDAPPLGESVRQAIPLKKAILAREVALYGCISRIQLTMRRIAALCASIKDTENTRLTYIPLNKTSTWFGYDEESRTWVIHLPDPISSLEILHARYVKHLDQYINWTTKPRAMDRLKLINAISALTDGDHDLQWHLKPEFVSVREQATTEHRSLMWNYEGVASELADHLERPLLHAVFDDYADTDEHFAAWEGHYFGAISRLNQSTNGRSYLRKRYQADRKALADEASDKGARKEIEAYLERHPEKKLSPAEQKSLEAGLAETEAGERSDWSRYSTLFDTERKISEATLNIVQEFGPVVIGTAGRFGVSEVEKILAKRLSISPGVHGERFRLELQQGKGAGQDRISIENRSISRTLTLVGASVDGSATVLKEMQARQLPSSDGASMTKRVSTLLQWLNAGLKLKQLTDATSAQDRVDGALGFAAASVAVFEDSHRIATRLFGKGAPVLGAVGSLFGLIDETKNAARNFQENDLDAAFMNGLIAAGELTATAGSLSIAGTLLTGGAASSATVVGLPAGAVMSVAGFLVGIGTIAVEFLEDPDLVRWFKHCEWGDARDGHAIVGDVSMGKSARGNYALQLQALHSVIADMTTR